MVYENTLVFLLIIFVIYLFRNSIKKVIFLRRLNNLPGPGTLPFIGSIYHVLVDCEGIYIIINSNIKVRLIEKRLIVKINC